MMLKHVIILLFVFFQSCDAQEKSQIKDSKNVSPSHELFSDLLNKYVVADKVNYVALQKDSLSLQKYLNLISNTPPTDDWSENEQLAFWINAYNAFTLKLIIDNYPIKSITDLHPTLHVPLLNTVWHKKFFEIGGEPMSLDRIEHKILRKEFDEPRIHFAINCASESCPRLRAEAFIADKLDLQLDQQAKLFLNDPTRNKLNSDNPEVSKIFSWFKGDFTKNGSLIQYLNQYSEVLIDEDADIDYLNYDWNLNDIK